MRSTLIFGWFFVIILCAACSEQRPQANASPVPVTIIKPKPAATFDAAAVGKNIYVQHCAVCHNDDGRGGEPVIDGKRLLVNDLRGKNIRKKTEAELIRSIMDGVPEKGMPAYRETLSEAELRAVAGHIRKAFVTAE